MAEATIEGLAFPSHLGGGIVPRSPFQRSLRILVAPCLPFSDAYQRPATKGAHPLGFPNDVASPRRCPSREPSLAGRRGCLSEASSAAAEKGSEGTALKNLKGSKAILDRLCFKTVDGFSYKRPEGASGQDGYTFGSCSDSRGRGAPGSSSNLHRGSGDGRQMNGEESAG